MPEQTVPENPAPEPPPTDAGGLYPIRTVSNLTGVNAVTLRAWERRYGLIRPQRTPKGHRLYTREDVQRINRILDLLNQGISIGQVRPLIETTSEMAPVAQEARGDAWEGYRDRLRRAVADFDEPALDTAYTDALSLYPVDLVIRKLAAPILRELGQAWKTRPTAIAEEHFFSAYLRNKIGTRIHHTNLRTTGRRLLLACLPGEYHEMGLLFFALAATSHGYRLLLLGANLPLAQIPPVLERQRCEAVVLSGTGRPGRDLLQSQLAELVRQTEVPVFVGGAISARHAQEVTQAGATPCGEDFQEALRVIGAHLRTAGKQR